MDDMRIHGFVNDRNDETITADDWIGKTFGGEQDNTRDLARHYGIDQFLQLIGISLVKLTWQPYAKPM